MLGTKSGSGGSVKSAALGQPKKTWRKVRTLVILGTCKSIWSGHILELVLLRQRKRATNLSQGKKGTVHQIGIEIFHRYQFFNIQLISVVCGSSTS